MIDMISDKLIISFLMGGGEFQGVEYIGRNEFMDGSARN